MKTVLILGNTNYPPTASVKCDPLHVVNTQVIRFTPTLKCKHKNFRAKFMLFSGFPVLFVIHVPSLHYYI